MSTQEKTDSTRSEFEASKTKYRNARKFAERGLDAQALEAAKAEFIAARREHFDALAAAFNSN